MGKPTLFIAAGHGDDDPGNSSVPGVVERDELITIVGRIKRWHILNGRSINVGGCVFIDDRHKLQGEIDAIRAWKPDDRDLAVDVHLDYGGSGRGALALIDGSELARAWSHAFLPRWCAATGIVFRGIHDSRQFAQANRSWPDFGFTGAAFPGVIVELGHMDNVFDLEIVRDPIYQVLAGEFMWQAWRDIQ